MRNISINLRFKPPTSSWEIFHSILNSNHQLHHERQFIQSFSLPVFYISSKKSFLFSFLFPPIFSFNILAMKKFSDSRCFQRFSTVDWWNYSFSIQIMQSSGITFGPAVKLQICDNETHEKTLTCNFLQQDRYHFSLCWPEGLFASVQFLHCTPNKIIQTYYSLSHYLHQPIINKQHLYFWI